MMMDIYTMTDMMMDIYNDGYDDRYIYTMTDMMMDIYTMTDMMMDIYHD